LKAAVYYGPNDIRIEEADYPHCPKGGLVIKVKAVGICGSDLRTYLFGSEKIDPPMILGHEVAGEVIEIDKDHHTYRLNDNIAMAPGIYCNKCYYCKHGMKTMCDNLQELAFQFQGGFAEYMPIPGIAFERGRIVSIPEGLSFEHAALCEPPTSCIMAQERAEVSSGDTVVILGAGPIGCIHIQVARFRGATTIIVIETSPERLKKSKSFNADYYLYAGKVNPIAEVNKITNGLGADKVIVAAPSAKAQEQAVEMCRKRGTIVFFGGLPRDHPFARLNTNLIHYRDIQIIGHYGQERHHASQSLEMLLRGQISAEKLITNILPLDEILQGFKLIKNKKALKVIIKPELFLKHDN
jgi:L-iditol 2-dehydrogenase